jgi:hypothetical protein
MINVTTVEITLMTSDAMAYPMSTGRAQGLSCSAPMLPTSRMTPKMNPTTRDIIM